MHRWGGCDVVRGIIGVSDMGQTPLKSFVTVCQPLKWRRGLYPLDTGQGEVLRVLSRRSRSLSGRVSLELARLLVMTSPTCMSLRVSSLLALPSSWPCHPISSCEECRKKSREKRTLQSGNCRLQPNGESRNQSDESIFFAEAGS